jgi:hypothetical protein
VAGSLAARPVRQRCGRSILSKGRLATVSWKAPDPDSSQPGGRILNAVEPCAETGDGEPPGQEPFCVLCGAPVGIFLAHGKDYRHYRGVLTATSKPRPYKADHAPVISWRPAMAAAVPATC